MYPILSGLWHSKCSLLWSIPHIIARIPDAASLSISCLLHPYFWSLLIAMKSSITFYLKHCKSFPTGGGDDGGGGDSYLWELSLGSGFFFVCFSLSFQKHFIFKFQTSGKFARKMQIPWTSFPDIHQFLYNFATCALAFSLFFCIVSSKQSRVGCIHHATLTIRCVFSYITLV